MDNNNNIEITLNGEKHTFPAKYTLADVVKSLGLVDKNIVAELEEDIISKEDFDKTPLKDGARLELIRFVGGG